MRTAAEETPAEAAARPASAAVGAAAVESVSISSRTSWQIRRTSALPNPLLGKVLFRREFSEANAESLSFAR